jgi:predicted MPP superfamily phosphohydrolase
VRARLPVLPKGSPNVRLGFLSDVHLGPTTPLALVEAAIGELAGANLDVLLLGGDYVFLDATVEKGDFLASQLARIGAARKFAVLGNHDLWTRHDILERALESVGVTLLINACAMFGDVAVVGLDDPWTGSINARHAFEGAHCAEAIVVLCHSPDGMPEAARALTELGHARPALYVCGHTHGGHIATPWGPLVLPGRIGKKYPAGFFDLGSMVLHVSRGIGGIELPMRTWAAPEVACIDLVATNT